MNSSPRWKRGSCLKNVSVQEDFQGENLTKNCFKKTNKKSKALWFCFCVHIKTARYFRSCLATTFGDHPLYFPEIGGEEVWCRLTGTWHGTRLSFNWHEGRSGTQDWYVSRSVLQSKGTISPPSVSHAPRQAARACASLYVSVWSRALWAVIN